MNPLALFAAVPAAAAALTAQNVSLQAIAVTPIPLHAVIEFAQSHNTLPTGQQVTSPFGSGAYAAIGFAAMAQVSWIGPTQVQDGAIDYRYFAYAHVEPNAPGTSSSATVDAHEILISLQPSAARVIRIVANVAVATTPGQTAPRLDVDLYDDGIVDGSTANGGFETGAMLVGSAIPLRLKVAGGVAVTNGEAASFFVDLRLRVLPVNDVTITRSGTGCVPLEFLVNEAFAHDGVRLGLSSSLNPHVVVLGLTAHPTVVSAFGPLPCILFPAPDAVLLGQPGGIDLPIPAAARPFGFHAQAVALSGFTYQLMFTDSYFVFAN